MIRLLVPSALGLVLLFLWAYCILDVIATDELVMRNLPKGLWLIVVVFLPTVGSIAWLALGRPPYAPWQPGGGSQPQHRRPPPRRGPVGPEDDPNWRS